MIIEEFSKIQVLNKHIHLQYLIHLWIFHPMGYWYNYLEAEKRAEEELSDSRKDAWNQALIQLGAGIIQGKTGEGLSKAGQTAYDMIKEGKASIIIC